MTDLCISVHTFTTAGELNEQQATQQAGQLGTDTSTTDPHCAGRKGRRPVLATAIIWGQIEGL